MLDTSHRLPKFTSPRPAAPSLSLMLLLAACGGGGGGGSKASKPVTSLANQTGLRSFVMHDDAGPEVLPADSLVEVNEALNEASTTLKLGTIKADWIVTSNSAQDALSVTITNRETGVNSSLEIRLGGSEAHLFKFVRDGQFYGIAFRDPPDAANPKDKDNDSDYRLEIRFLSPDRKNDTDYDFVLYRVRVTDANGVHLQQRESEYPSSVLTSPSRTEGVQDIQIREGDNRSVIGEAGEFTMKYFFVDGGISASVEGLIDLVKTMSFQSLDVINDGSTLVMTSRTTAGDIITTHFSIAPDTYVGSSNDASSDASNFMFTTDGSSWKLLFRQSPDFEAPRDGRDNTQQDNVYHLELAMRVLNDGWDSYNRKGTRLKITVRNDESDDMEAPTSESRHLDFGGFEEPLQASADHEMSAAPADII